jgi:hypothetical protein
MEIPGIIHNLGRLGTYVSARGSGVQKSNIHHAPQQHMPDDWAMYYQGDGGGDGNKSQTKPKPSVSMNHGAGGVNFEDDIPPTPVADDDDWNSEKLKDVSELPTSSRIEEIITSLKVFNIKSAMPPKLVFTETADDLALEENVRMLFSDAVCDRLRLIESLKLVLLTENSLMSEAQKKNIRKLKEKRLDANQKEDIKKFYPCLVALMNVLLIRCDAKTRQDTTADATVAHVLLVMWRNVMSKLGEIFSAIVYGKSQGLIDLGTFPTEWAEIIKDHNKIIQSVTRSSREIKNKRLQLNQQINKRNEAIEAINEQYAVVDSELKLCESKYTGVEHLLDSLTQVGQMVKKNKRDIDELQK